MFWRRQALSVDQDEVRAYFEQTARTVALLDADNGRYQQALTTSPSVLDAARVQYYLHSLTFVEHAYVFDHYSTKDPLPRFLQRDFRAYGSLFDEEVFFSRLRFLLLREGRVFPVTQDDVLRWKVRVEAAQLRYETDHLKALSTARLVGEEWMGSLLEIGRAADSEVPELSLATLESQMATAIWERGFVWSLAVSQEVVETDELADRLFPYALAAICAADLASANDRDADRRNLRLISAAVAEESFQTFHTAVADGRVRLSEVVGLVVHVAADQALGRYRAFADLPSSDLVEGALQRALAPLIGNDYSEVASGLLLNPEDDRA